MKEGQKIKRSEESAGIINKRGMDPREFMAIVLNWDLAEIGLTEEQIKEIDVRTQIEIRCNMARELAPYVAPRLKAIEHSIDPQDKETFEQYVQRMSKEHK